MFLAWIIDLFHNDPVKIVQSGHFILYKKDLDQAAYLTLYTPSGGTVSGAVTVTTNVRTGFSSQYNVVDVEK